MLSHNNQVFVACCARAMKTQLDGSGVQIDGFSYYGDCDGVWSRR